MSEPNDPLDPLLERLRAAAEGAPAPGAGRVLSVKPGYNPNSSSVGSVVTALFWSATAAAAALNLTAALLARRAAERAAATPPDAEA